MSLASFLLRRSRRIVVLATLAALGSGASTTVLLALLNRTLSGPLAGSRNLPWAFFGTCLTVLVLRIVSELLLIRLGQDTIFKLRVELSRQVLKVPLAHLEKIGSHRILATLTEDIPTITNAITLIPILCFNAAVLFGGFVYLLFLSRIAFLAIVLLMVVGVVSYQVPIIKANRLFLRARRTSDDLYNHFRALTQGLKELKLHRRRREAFLRGSLESSALQFKHQTTEGFSIYAIASGWGQFLLFAIIGLVLYVLPSFAPLSKEALIGYALVFLNIMTPLQMVMNSLPTLGRSGIALQRIDAIGLELAAVNEPEATSETESPWPSWRLLELNGVTHSYRREGDEGEFVLGPIDLALTRGELVFLTGGNGSGKTTLAKVLIGLYPPQKGEIRLAGRTVTDEVREDYRELFSVVFSDFHLFETLLGLEHPTLDSRAREYLAKLRLNHMVKVKDGELSTINLSQGQRKRLALLTAYLENRSIYLFDEWAADQDPLFKEIFYYQLLPELKARGKALIVISHDDRYYQVADRVIKLEYGKLQQVEIIAAPAKRALV